MAFGGARIIPVQMLDDPVRLFDSSIQIDGGIIAPFPQRNFMHQQIRHNRMARRMAALERMHVPRIANTLIERFGGHICFRVPPRADIEGTRPLFVT